WWAYHNNKPFVDGCDDDTAWRTRLATQDNDFRLLFETAKTVKHGRLTRGTPPSVRAIDQVVSEKAGWDSMRWDHFRWDVDQVRIEPIGETPWAVEGVLVCALAFLE